MAYPCEPEMSASSSSEWSAAIAEDVKRKVKKLKGADVENYLAWGRKDVWLVIGAPALFSRFCLLQRVLLLPGSLHISCGQGVLLRLQKTKDSLQAPSASDHAMVCHLEVIAITNGIFLRVFAAMYHGFETFGPTVLSRLTTQDGENEKIKCDQHLPTESPLHPPFEVSPDPRPPRTGRGFSDGLIRFSATHIYSPWV